MILYDFFFLWIFFCDVNLNMILLLFMVVVMEYILFVFGFMYWFVVWLMIFNMMVFCRDNFLLLLCGLVMDVIINVDCFFLIDDII